jgi:hypothetical protein
MVPVSLNGTRRFSDDGGQRSVHPKAPGMGRFPGLGVIGLVVSRLIRA